MGRDKANLNFSGESFLSHIINEFSMFQEIIISSCNDRYTGLGFPVVLDNYIDCGPLAGIHAALSACKSDALLFIPCDTPLFSKELGAFLIDQMEPDLDAVIARASDGLHPLCGVYRKEAADKIASCIEAGIRKIDKATESLRTKTVNIEKHGFDKTLLSNINTPQEYEQFCFSVKEL